MITKKKSQVAYLLLLWVHRKVLHTNAHVSIQNYIFESFNAKIFPIPGNYAFSFLKKTKWKVFCFLRSETCLFLQASICFDAHVKLF